MRMEYVNMVRCDTSDMKNEEREQEYLSTLWWNKDNSRNLRGMYPIETKNLDTDAKVVDWYYENMLEKNSKELKARYGDI